MNTHTSLLGNRRLECSSPERENGDQHSHDAEGTFFAAADVANASHALSRDVSSVIQSAVETDFVQSELPADACVELELADVYATRNHPLLARTSFHRKGNISPWSLALVL